MNSVAILKPRKQRSWEWHWSILRKAQASGGSCVSTQRTAASAGNLFIQRAILFDLKECRSRLSSPGAFRIWSYGKFRRRESRKSFSILARKLSLMVRRVRTMTIGVTWSANSFRHADTNQLARLIFRSLPQQKFLRSQKKRCESQASSSFGHSGRSLKAIPET